MVARSAAVLARMQRSGISAVAPLMGLRALQSILLVPASTVSNLFLHSKAVTTTVPCAWTGHSEICWALNHQDAWKPVSYKPKHPHSGELNILQVAAIPVQWEVFLMIPQGRSPFYSNFAAIPMALHMVSHSETADSFGSSVRACTAQAGGSPHGGDTGAT